MNITRIPFKPLFGSRHLQMFLATFAPSGKEPPSHQWLVDLDHEDRLSCSVSAPAAFTKTIVLIHGLGGSHTSSYMIRMARKLYGKGHKVVRVNLRGCGSGKGLSKLPYNAGNSHDILKVLQALKKQDPSSDILVIGFSLGANLALKLAGELGPDAHKFVKTFIAVSPPLDLEHTASLLLQKQNYLYHRYYLRQISKQAKPWTSQKFPSLYAFDENITGPLWGFNGAQDYYLNCSSKYFLHKICVPSHIICAEDDPFISIAVLRDMCWSNHVRLWTTEYGSHMGFLGRSPFYWMDNLLLNWVEGNFTH